jgi:Ni,Fe-hydrogenase I cytochrome b subunit
MEGHALTILIVLQIIVVISTGFFTVDAFAGNIQAFDLGIRLWQQMLLYVHSQAE